MFEVEQNVVWSSDITCDFLVVGLTRLVHIICKLLRLVSCVNLIVIDDHL